MNASVLSLRANPVRLLFSAAPWASAGYLLGYLFTGTVLFAITLAAVVVGVVLSFTLAGLPVLVAVAVTIRWCANAERLRLRTVYGGPVRGRYRQPGRPGILTQLRVRWSDPATWRDLAVLIVLYAPRLALGTAVLTVWLILLAGITLPAWYRYPNQTWTIGVSGGNDARAGSAHGVQLGYFPEGPHSHGSWGIYVDTLPKALAVAVVCLIGFLLFNYVLVATARLHAAVTRALLRAQEDPLRQAREVLNHPGPLRRFIQNGSGTPPGTPGSPPAGPSQPAGHG